MTNFDVIRAWKDEEYRDSLSEAERAQLPEDPAGAIELQDFDLSRAAGGTATALTCYFYRRGTLCRPTRSSQTVGGRRCGTYTCTC